MGTISTKEFSANEKDMAVLLHDTGELKKLLFAAHEEMRSIQKTLVTELPGTASEELKSRRESLLYEFGELQTECVELNRKAHNHRHDLQGMRECEDVGCETFYHSEHQKLRIQIENFLAGLEELKSGTIRYTRDLPEQWN